MYCNCTSNPRWQSQQKQIKKQNQPCKHDVLHVHIIYDQSMPMAMAMTVQQTEHVINTVPLWGILFLKPKLPSVV